MKQVSYILILIFCSFSKVDAQAILGGTNAPIDSNSKHTM